MEGSSIKESRTNEIAPHPDPRLGWPLNSAKEKPTHPFDEDDQNKGGNLAMKEEMIYRLFFLLAHDA